MTTRREFSGKLLSAVAAGTLANYALVAEAKPCAPFEEGIGDKCNENGKSDQCHGSGAKTDQCRAPAPDAEPVCKTDTCSQSDKNTGNE